MFKKKCFNCGELSDNVYPLCSNCRPALINIDSSCRICGIPTTRFVKICPSCRHNSKIVKSNYSILSYSGISKEILTQYKFKKDLSYAQFFSQHIISYIHHNFKSAIICPVPTSKLKRKIKNGYQLDSIVKELKKNGLKVRYLLKKRYSKTQKKLGRLERSKNLVHSFNLKNKVHENDVIVLIDDVFTTGATIDACCKILKEKSRLIYSITLYRD